MQNNMTPEKLASVKRILCHLLERGGIKLNAYVEQFQQHFSVHMNESWTIHGVRQTEGKVSFMASVKGYPPILFIVKDEDSQEKAENWITSMQVFKVNELTKETANCVVVPDEIVFIVGCTDYVPNAIERQQAVTT